MSQRGRPPVPRYIVRRILDLQASRFTAAAIAKKVGKSERAVESILYRERHRPKGTNPSLPTAPAIQPALAFAEVYVP